MNSQAWAYRVSYLKHYRTGPLAGKVTEGLLLLTTRGQAEEAFHALSDGVERESTTYPRGKYRVAPGSVHIRGLL